MQRGDALRVIYLGRPSDQLMATKAGRSGTATTITNLQRVQNAAGFYQSHHFEKDETLNA
jgi:hypothetical protein